MNLCIDIHIYWPYIICLNSIRPNRQPWLYSCRRLGSLRKRPALLRVIWRWKPVCSICIISFRISDVFFGGVGGRDGEEKTAWICNFKVVLVTDIPRPDVTHRGDWAILFIWHLKRSMRRQRFQRSKWSHLRTEENFCIGLGIGTWTSHWERTTWSFMNIVASHVFFAPDPNPEMIQFDSSLTGRFFKWVGNHHLGWWRQIGWHSYEFCPFSPTPAFLRSVC